MTGPSPWRLLEQRVGVPVRFALAEDGAARTYAANSHARKFGRDLGAAQGVVLESLGEAFGFDAETIVTWADGAVDVPLRDDEWLARLADPAVVSPEFATVGAWPDAPACVDTDGTTWAWAEVAEIIGLDSLTWAVLRSTSRRQPYRLEPALTLLAGRSDANPLSLVRRAHARIEGALRGVDVGRGPRFGGQGSQAPRAETAHRLRTALLVHDSSAARDAGRRPVQVMRALETVAAEALAHLERAPASRTDVPALEAARRVLKDALRALGLDAPTPY